MFNVSCLYYPYASKWPVHSHNFRLLSTSVLHRYIIAEDLYDTTSCLMVFRSMVLLICVRRKLYAIYNFTSAQSESVVDKYGDGYISKSSSTISKGFLASKATAARVFISGSKQCNLQRYHDGTRATRLG